MLQKVIEPFRSVAVTSYSFIVAVTPQRVFPSVSVNFISQEVSGCFFTQPTGKVMAIQAKTRNKRKKGDFFTLFFILNCIPSLKKLYDKNKISTQNKLNGFIFQFKKLVDKDEFLNLGDFFDVKAIFF